MEVLKRAVIGIALPAILLGARVAPGCPDILEEYAEPAGTGALARDRSPVGRLTDTLELLLQRTEERNENLRRLAELRDAPPGSCPDCAATIAKLEKAVAAQESLNRAALQKARAARADLREQALAALRERGHDTSALESVLEPAAANGVAVVAPAARPREEPAPRLSEPLAPRRPSNRDAFRPSEFPAELPRQRDAARAELARLTEELARAEALYEPERSGLASRLMAAADAFRAISPRLEGTGPIADAYYSALSRYVDSTERFRLAHRPTRQRINALKNFIGPDPTRGETREEKLTRLKTETDAIETDIARLSNEHVIAHLRWLEQVDPRRSKDDPDLTARLDAAVTEKRAELNQREADAIANYEAMAATSTNSFDQTVSLARARFFAISLLGLPGAGGQDRAALEAKVRAFDAELARLRPPRPR